MTELDAITQLFLLLIFIGAFFTFLGLVAGAIEAIAIFKRQVARRRHMATPTKPRH